ncbi:DNA-directed RNA polymerase subunit delta [Paenibacillus oryzisoli]|uniref:DNA-directed RNA polymerase subunit delta n=1 Tax=Paenibacillus oryzisoli TaxID=1850517 RepID=UPI003D2BEBB5
MSSGYTLKITAEQAREMPMVDLAFELLKSANTPYYYRDLMAEIAKIKGLSDEQIMQVIAQLYTEINIDGRFACVGTNLWGLKRWYPVEKSDDSVGGGAKRPRIINDEDDDMDEDVYPEEEDTYTEEDEYDAFGEDAEEEEAEEDTEFFEDEEIDEELEDAGIDESEEAEEDDLDEEADEDGEADDFDDVDDDDEDDK